jgi:predicted esterase
VIGGFSQGGFLSLALAGKAGAPRYAGVWAICCGLPGAPDFEFDLADGDGRPVLFQWGTKDPVIGPDAPAEVISALQAGGWNLDHHAYEMAHSQTIEMMIDARAWLSTVL